MLGSTARVSRPVGVFAHLRNGTKPLPGGIRMPPFYATRSGYLNSTLALRRYSCKTANQTSEKPKSGEHCANKIHAITPMAFQFWTSAPIWKRAAINTLRCLIGCTSGDFSAMWFLQAFYPGIGTGVIMGIAMASGLTTSMLLETILLRYGRDKLSWSSATKTAVGMSFISMLTMEAAQNMVDYHLTGGTVAFDSPAFWAAAVISMGAGFLAPLPYNYLRLRKYGKACH
ncbi:uncharacterized protein F4822DRAFT_394369 [Hypoxylon trugodes]|uniref:uncharacterized protein n=1 Tax=Hypoxylon trugodes TaxID=326681 RepID=UPI0021953533|nr:uncharacterized protein F4822DRAFT_394369 [Hypoxylon trugodes]KAI1390760.1 hypothetical protein F4822DRAFT_394369 [Hypoxylon trugodes]